MLIQLQRSLLAISWIQISYVSAANTKRIWKRKRILSKVYQTIEQLCLTGCIFKYIRQEVLSRRVAITKQRAGCGANCERGSRQTMTNSELAKVNVRQGALAFSSILVSRSAFCFDNCSEVCGPSMSGNARRLSQMLIVEDRPWVCSLLFGTFRTCTCVLCLDLEHYEAPGKRSFPMCLDAAFHAC